MNRIRTLIALVGVPEAVPPWSLLYAVLTLIFAFIAMIVGVLVGYTWVGLNNQGLSELIGWSLGGLLIVAYIWQTRRQQRATLHLESPHAPLLFIMFISFGLALALDLLGLAVTREFYAAQEFEWLNPNALGVAEWVFAVAFILIIQPIAEELLFRGITLPIVRARLGAWAAILTTALITGLFHVAIYPMNYAEPLKPVWYGFVVPVVAALVFGIVRLSTKSTRAAMVAHAAFGLLALAKLLMLTGR